MSLLDRLRLGDPRLPSQRWKLTAYELAFRAACRHRQGPKPNILLFCTRRGGSTWVCNTVASHPGMRQVGHPFRLCLYSRWRSEIPGLADAAQHLGDYDFEVFVHFEGEAKRRFEDFARRIVTAERHIYPTVRFWASYFNRTTERVIFQMTNTTALIEWFDASFPATTALFLRHPIPNALSILQRGWRDECADFMNHRWFVETCLSGEQVDLARRVLREGSPLARHVLDWSLKMLLPIRAVQSGRHPEWFVFSYEQLVLQRAAMLEQISERLDLPDLAALQEQAKKPSRTVSPETVGQIDNPDFLLGRWRSQVGLEEEADLMRIPTAFGIDAYEAGRLEARAPYWMDLPTG